MLTGQAHLAERRRGRWCHPIFFFPSSALLFRSCRIQREADDDNTHTTQDRRVCRLHLCVGFTTCNTRERSNLLAASFTRTHGSGSATLPMFEWSQLGGEQSRSIVLI